MSGLQGALTFHDDCELLPFHEGGVAMSMDLKQELRKAS